MSWLRSVSKCALVAGALLLVPMGTAVAQRVQKAAAADGSVLPFPPAPSASIAAPSPAGFEARAARRAEAFATRMRPMC